MVVERTELGDPQDASNQNGAHLQIELCRKVSPVTGSE